MNYGFLIILGILGLIIGGIGMIAAYYEGKDKMKIKLGSIIKHKLGGPKMAVCNMYDSHSIGENPIKLQTIVGCWFDKDDKLRHESFTEEVLVLAEE